MREIFHLSDLEPMIGTEVAVSDWILVDQELIKRFAEVTGDSQWIHVDPQRAAKSPFGSTVAHGLLTLGLLPQMYLSAFRIADVKMGVNYGFDRVRFTAPVPCGSRLRGRFTLTNYLAIEGGAQLTFEAVIERE